MLQINRLRHFVTTPTEAHAFDRQSPRAGSPQQPYSRPQIPATPGRKELEERDRAAEVWIQAKPWCNRLNQFSCAEK